MVFKIEKETKWSSNLKKPVETFYIWADKECVAVANNEDHAIELYENAKENYAPKKTEIIRHEELN